jgi:hypothetical protein
MDHNAELKSFETGRDHTTPESTNLLDDGISLHQERPSMDDRSYGNHSQQDFSIPPTPTFQYNSTFDNSRSSIRSYASNNPYNHVNQDSFYNTLQDNIRHFSIQSSSVWTQSRSSTPVNDQRNINHSNTWGSTVHLMKDEMPSPMVPFSTFKEQMEGRMNSGSDSGVDSPGSPKLPPAGPPAGPPAIKFSKFHEILFIANVCLAQLMSLAALAQTVSPLIIIGESLGVTHPGQLPWFTAAYSMSLGTFIIPAGM